MNVEAEIRVLGERLTSLERRLEDRITADSEALRLATSALNERLGHLNQWREGAVTKEMFAAEISSVEKAMETQRSSLEDIERWRAELAGEHSQIKTTVSVNSGRLSELENWKSNVAGRTWALGIIGALGVTIFSVFVNFAVHYILVAAPVAAH